MKFILNFITVALFLTSCSSFTTNIKTHKELDPIEDDKPIYIFYEGYDELPDNAEFIGDITVEIKWGIMPSVRDMLYELEEEVKQIGGNFLMVDKEDYYSNTEAINGKVYYLPEFGKSGYDEISLEEELKNREIKPLEGIYVHEFLNPYTNELITLKFGILKVSESQYQVIYLSGFDEVRYLVGWTEPYRTWESGDIYGFMNDTQKENFYEARMYKLNKSLELNGTAKIDNKNLRIYLRENLNTFMKVFPDSGRYEVPVGSLTGFALDDRNILTCYHGITDTELEIFVKGLNGDFDTKYKAKVVAKDKNLDLAVLQLVDSTVNLNFISFPKAEEEKSISEKVFVLGYPMSTMMGDDIKLTDGLISSTTGIGGSLKEYQISAPIQQGNSGSPCFDGKGNFIGIVNSGIKHADNVGYSLKLKYIDEFLEKHKLDFKTTTEDELKEAPFVNKVKNLKQSIYLIELTDTEPPKPKNYKKRIRR